MVRQPNLDFECAMQRQGYQIIAGVDEAGRGPLAGPVVAAACILPRGLFLEGIDDSKKLRRDKRKSLFQILTKETEYGVGIVDVDTIDTINILQATLKAMQLALDNLPQRPDYILVDGNMKLPTDIPYASIIKGDQQSQSIAAASILAKETRDRIMEEYHVQYPHYGFAKHKGYGTAVHRAAIKEHGRSPIHRQTFSVS